ncbi:copper homeostasis protein CutC [Chryseobacterium balustinum]|uniref:Copper homeostasis protein cutC homolog n=1 Tax=Chryseobacterium balustinum TaxID=246 RepID=A0AAX2INX8_9FLAO|nr:copper homeostasis protein CutC [Chryseobacterium balustinum]AZB30046.1 copper homeostasis protein CutC [Chryseobacterium balustinum]SKB66778.1 copper homeostasis protein [Chryseobacterium balustinum]SQA91744.1 Copper homeostasis protein CutC [Chryseobacterium balustinum]
MFLEIATFDIASAEIALNSVADRIEFCADINSGGITPDLEELRYLKEKYSKPIHVMIRPVGGGFLYTDSEFRQMQKSIIEFSKTNADGFVFGILDEYQEIDIDKNKILIELANGKPCVFHRAIDRTKNIFESTEKLIELGFKEILTSGGENSAMEGKENLKKLVEGYSDDIKILIGGGVRSNNISELKNVTKGQYFHSSAVLSYESFANADEIKKLKVNL